MFDVERRVLEEHTADEVGSPPADVEGDDATEGVADEHRGPSDHLLAKGDGVGAVVSEVVSTRRM